MNCIALGCTLHQQTNDATQTQEIIMEKLAIRIVAAVNHNETGELEVIVETTSEDSKFAISSKLTSIWLTKEELAERAS